MLLEHGLLLHRVPTEALAFRTQEGLPAKEVADLFKTNLLIFNQFSLLTINKVSCYSYQALEEAILVPEKKSTFFGLQSKRLLSRS